MAGVFDCFRRFSGVRIGMITAANTEICNGHFQKLPKHGEQMIYYDILLYYILPGEAMRHALLKAKGCA